MKYGIEQDWFQTDLYRMRYKMLFVLVWNNSESIEIALIGLEFNPNESAPYLDLFPNESKKYFEYCPT